MIKNLQAVEFFTKPFELLHPESKERIITSYSPSNNLNYSPLQGA
jgi:hypothetical protein